MAELQLFKKVSQPSVEWSIYEVMPQKRTAKYVDFLTFDIWPIQSLLPGHYNSIDWNVLNKYIHTAHFNVAYAKVIGYDMHAAVDFQVDSFGCGADRRLSWLQNPSGSRALWKTFTWKQLLFPTTTTTCPWESPVAERIEFSSQQQRTKPDTRRFVRRSSELLAHKVEG